ncbi:flavin reductase family protein [Nocardioides sp. TRM66260-LWL]|uniref:flavin reductase family protein n=1 Tax=Nocardioides sp. TRM66260-LWL TaxID=2874478 RepID=UPI001CC46160|nr:flavin reductase family protein [Nocardioides sp. TRM66260-LWL]MBZ5736039.1 flavin reductase family protein [Nocardioides sp. TRM66260-LWL]
MSTRRVVHAPSADEQRSLYPLLTAVVVPRPIAWISTVDADGVGNLAPHSFFTVACANPAIVQFTSVGAKDTLRNVRATGEFVVSMVSEPLMDAANATAAPYAAEVDEAEAVGLRMEPSATVRPFRVADSPTSLECRLHSTHELGDSTIVLGTVTAVTVLETALDGDHPTMAALAPVSRLGRDEWGRPPEVVRLARPTTA